MHCRDRGSPFRFRLALRCLLAVPALFLAACGQEPAAIHPSRQHIVESVFATGRLVLSDEYVLSTSQEGFVDTVFVDIGDRIEAGAPLFRLMSPATSSRLATARAEYQDAVAKTAPDSPSLLSLSSQIDQAARQRDHERENLERTRVLFESGVAARTEYDQAQVRYEAARADLEVLEQSLADLQASLALGVEMTRNQLRIVESEHDDTLIRAARAGLVLDLFLEHGELARKGEVLGRLGSGVFLAELLVAEEDIGLVREGQPVAIRLNTDPGRVVDAIVTTIRPSFDVSEQSFLVEASFAPDGRRLYSGTQLEAEIVVEERPDTMAIPIAYLEADSLVTLVDGRVVGVAVRSRAHGWAEIVSNLTDSDQIRDPR
jgi:multidrug efflux pump subunit AcrA (membrane-fusion protein)